MRKVLFCLMDLIALAALGATATSLEYTVSYVAGATTVHVEAVVADLPVEEIELVFRREASYVSEHVSNLDSSAGEPRPKGEGRWAVSGSRRNLTYSYDIDSFVRWRPIIYWATDNEIAVYFDDECGILMAPFFFIYPDEQTFTSIRVRFQLPPGWDLVVPYTEQGEFYEVKQTTTNLLHDFILRQNIYMGPMRFYSESTAAGSQIKFGRLMGDDSLTELSSQGDVEAYVEATAKGAERLAEIFGVNPHDVFAMHTNFKKLVSGEWLSYPGGRYAGDGYQYWPEERWDELTGHLRSSWIRGWFAPLLADSTLVRGIFGDYYGPMLAWELYGNPSNLAKMYHYYLLYEWMYEHHDREPESYTTREDEYETYIRWAFIGMLLDEEIRKRSNGAHALEDAFRWLYETYENTGYRVTPYDLEQAISVATGVSVSDLYATYVYEEAKIPVEDTVRNYREHFVEYSPAFEKSHLVDHFYGHSVPFFVEIVLAASLAEHLHWGIGGERLGIAFADRMLDEYELEALTEEDVTAVLSDMTGEDCSSFFTHWSESYGPLDVEEVRAWLEDFSRGIPSSVASAGSSPDWASGIRFGLDIDGSPDLTWERLATHKEDREGDATLPAADIVDVFVHSDERLLYLRVDTAGSPNADDVVYKVGIQPLSVESRQHGSYLCRTVSSEGAVLEGLGGIVGAAAVGVGEVIELAIPLEWLGICDYIKVSFASEWEEVSRKRIDAVRVMTYYFPNQ